METPGELFDRQSTVDLRKRLVLVLAGVTVLVLVYAIIYRWIVFRYTGEERSLVTAIQVVIEALTTAGFGGDTELWLEHSELSLFVILMNLTGVLLVFLALPLLAVPLFKRAFDTQPPTETDLTDHVVICGHSAVDDILREELDEAGVPYLFVQADATAVKQLNADGFEAIYGDAAHVETLRNANLGAARAIVADLDDETNPTVILSANRVNPETKIVSVVENRDAVTHHRYAGADEVVVSKQSLGESLAMRSIKTIAERFEQAIGLTTKVDFGEYLVEEDSDLVGTTLKAVTATEGSGLTVVGGWFGPRFLVSPPPETEIRENSILLVAGEHEKLLGPGVRKLPTHRGHPSRVVVCGHGDVGRAVVKTLEAEDIDVTTVDNRGHADADLVADVTEDATIEAADVAEARSVILAVESDVTAIYGTILVRHHAPDVEIIARANDPDNVWKLYNAGADYVLSIPAVTGEVLASALIEGEELLTPHDDFEFVRTAAPALTGRTLGEVGFREQTGCALVGIERADELLTALDPDVTIEAGDMLVAAGSGAAVDRFRSLAGEGS